MFNSSELISKEICEVKDSLRMLDSIKNKNYFNGISLKELFSTKGLSFTKEEIEEIIDLKVPKSIFLSSKEYYLNKTLLVNKLMRFKKYEESKTIKRNVLKNANSTIIDIDGINIRVDYHLILDNTCDVIEVIKVKNKKCDLKKRGRSIHTKISDSMELFLLQKAGEKLFPTKKVYGTIVFLTNPKDSGNQLSEEFESKENENIVSYHFEGKEVDVLTDRVIITATTTKTTCSDNCDNCEYSNICNYTHLDYTKLEVIPPSAKAGKVTFTPSQLDFIQIKEGNYRVLAGAGSGKTTVIANRIVELVKNGTMPSNILLITYTNKGVEELKEKINYWLNIHKVGYTANEFDIFTFNSFGFELIKKEYKSLGFTEEPKVLDKMTKIEIIKDLLDNRPQIKGLNYVYPFMSLFNAKGAVIKVAEYFDIIKNNGLIYTDEIMEECLIEEEDVAKDILETFLEYSNILKTNNLIDFSDQLELAYKILSNQANLKKYGYEHIIVDEFQDSDVIQINTLKLLRNYPYCKSLVVVGDDAQSIFSFRGANQFNIINFHKYFNNVEDIAMEENFRSTKEICSLANYLNSINKHSVPKKLLSTNTGAYPVLIYNNTIDTITKLISEKVSKGTKPNDICVIARNKKELIDLQKRLNTLGIPSIIAISEVLIDNDKVKNIIGYSNFLVDTSLDLHFAEYLQITKYEEFTKAMNRKNLESFLNNEKSKFLAKYNSFSNDKEKIEFFFESLLDVAKIDKSVASLLETCKEKEFNSIEELNAFLSRLIPFESDLYVEKSDDNYNAVTLTTAHSSKGREFSDVYVSLDKFKYPRVLTEKNRNTQVVEEERRLLFVAITRAKKNLTLVVGNSSSVFTELKEAFNSLGYPLL